LVNIGRSGEKRILNLTLKNKNKKKSKQKHSTEKGKAGYSPAFLKFNRCFNQVILFSF